MGHSEVDVDFAVYSRFAKSKYRLHNAFAQADIPSGEPVFIELPRDLKSDMPEKRHLWSQYFDFANLEYTAKSISTSLCPTGPL